MKKQPYDAYFEKLYDQFISETNTENLSGCHAEKFETFLHNAARKFYNLGKQLLSMPEVITATQ